MKIPNSSTVYFFRRPPLSSTGNSFPPFLKQLQDVSSFYFVYEYEVHQPYFFTFISFIHLPFSQISPSTAPILQSCLSLLIPKPMFTGVFQSIPGVSKLYFGQLNFLHYSSLPLLSHYPLFSSFPYISLYPLPV
jgi:hypothetical protein